MPNDGMEKNTYYANGSTKIVWAWAGVTTLLIIAILGFLARVQWETNESLRRAVTNLGTRVGRLELQIENLERTIRERED